MGKENEFAQKIIDAGILIDGIVGSGPTCQIVFAAVATPAQRAAAVALRASFDWAEKVALTEAALTAKLRQLDPMTLNQLVCSVTARMILAAGMPEQYGAIPTYSPASPVPTPTPTPAAM